MQPRPADTVEVVLKNNTDSDTLYAHITGNDSKGLFVLGADGATPHHPTSPSSTLQPLQEDSGIAISGGKGSSRTVFVPRIFGARIWFCRDVPLTFFVNPGPALVEPSATNQADENYNKDWGFCEFTYNDAEIYVNVSYVDFVSLPIGLQLENEAGHVRRVDGMPADGLQRVAAGLEEQGKKEAGVGWEKLVVKEGSRVQRVLSPNAAMVLFPGIFETYFQGYVDAVWDRYSKEDLVVNTQFGDWGEYTGRVGGDGLLTFNNDKGDTIKFDKPVARDIFSCSTGPFAGGPDVSPQKLNIGARLSAALNRSTLLENRHQPEGEDVGRYYCCHHGYPGKGTKDVKTVTNHYSRVCHEASVESRGYAFPYDDVGSSKGEDQSGFLSDPKPKRLTVVVGGGSF
jgi:hypothetical protein